MAAEFKVAAAYADFHIDGVEDEVKDAVRRLKAKSVEFDRAGKQAGDAYSKGFRGGVSLVPTIDREIAKLRAKNNQFANLGHDAGEAYSRGFRTGANLRPAMVESIATVKSSRAAFAAEGRQAGQAYAKGFGGQHVAGPTVSGGGGNGEAAGEKIAKDMAEGVRKGSKDVDTELSRTAKRANSAFDALKFAGLAEGLPAAAGAGAAGVGVALIGATALLGGFFAKQAWYAENVSKTWDDNFNLIQASVMNLSHQFEGPLINAANMVGERYKTVFPLISAGAAASVPAVEKLTKAGLDLGENALPGLVKSAQASGAALDGFGSFAAKTGAGVSDMFTHFAAASQDAGQGLSKFGDIGRAALNFTGELVQNLAANQGELVVLQGGLAAAEQTLLNVTAAGSGFVGVLHGFGTAGTGALSTIQALSALLGLLPPQVTQFGGSLLAANMIASKFGVDVGASFDGIGKKVKSAGDGLSGMTKFTKTAGSALTELAGAAINPASLAVVGLGIGLSILGEHQQQAAQYAAQHTENVRALTQAIRDDSGVLGDHVAQVNIQALADKNAAANLSVLGKNMGDAKLAIEGNTSAYQGLLKAGRDRLTQLGANAQFSKDDQQALAGLADQALSTGQNYEQLTQTQSRGNDVLAQLNQGYTSSTAALINGLGAVGEQINSQKQAHQAYLDSEHALTGLAAAQVEARDATVEHTNAIYAQQNASLGYRGAVLATKQAQDEYSKTLKDGKASTDDKARAELGLEQAMAAQEAAAQQAAYANSTATTEAGKQADATRALNQETVNIANTFSGKLPASLQQTISKMTASEAEAVGLKVKYNNLGQAVYELPNGKQIVITSNAASVINQIKDVQRKMGEIDGRVATTYIRTIYENGSSNTTRFGNQGAGRGNAAMADGGVLKFFASGGFNGLTPMKGGVAQVVPSNTWRVIGDNPKVPEAYVPLDRGSARSQAILDQANAMMGRDQHITVPVTTSAPNITLNVYQQPNQDINAFAALVSRKIEQQRKAA